MCVSVAKRRSPRRQARKIYQKKVPWGVQRTFYNIYYNAKKVCSRQETDALRATVTRSCYEGTSLCDTLSSLLRKVYYKIYNVFVPPETKPKRRSSSSSSSSSRKRKASS